ncbi:hypothetical protein M0802_000863 [Mischocyttarus mexicanus]|nr:hypothetical protein M0802_000863 [Mischocyttarus mexicanus]
MVDFEKDKGNISLPQRLQSPDPDEKKKGKRVEPMIINMQKAVYDLKINNINNKIQRLQELNDKLINDHEETALLLTSIDAKTANEIAQLRRHLSIEVSKLEEYKNKLNVLEKGIINDKLLHIEKVNSINDKYTRKRLELISEIKPLNAKINMLEDYRRSQSVLKEKLDNKNHFLLEEEEKVENEVKQIQLKFKLDREKLKKDMYNRLLDSAGIFQMEISTYMQEPIHKLIRENIMLNNYLTEVINENLSNKNIFKNFEHTKKMLFKKKKLNYLDTRYNIKVTNIQNHLLKIFKEVHKDTEKRLISFNILNQYNPEKYSIDRDQAQAQTHTSELHMIDSNSKFAQMDTKNLLLCLQDIIVEGQDCMSNIMIKSIESIPQSSNVYIHGDLGFEPIPIKLRESTQVVEEEIFPSIISEAFSIKNLEKQSKEVLMEDKSSIIFEAPSVKEYIETEYSNAEDSVSEKFEVTEINDDESYTEIFKE